MTGKYLSRTFICTHTDNIIFDNSEETDLDKRLDELKRKEKKTKEETEFIEKIEKSKEEYDDIDIVKQLSVLAAKCRNEKVKQDLIEFELQTQRFVKHDASTCNLQVFTVSSTDYMKLKKFLCEDGRSIFQNTEDTEIPKLVNHLKEISKINISNKIGNFIKSIEALVESMLRYTDDNILLENPEKRDQARNIFIEKRNNSVSRCRNIVENIMKEFLNEIDKYILVEMKDVGKIKAENECTSIINRQGNYLHHTTWKDTVIRNGCYIDLNGVTHNFNAELLRPIIKSVTDNWFVVFNETPKKLVEQLEDQVEKVLTNYFNIIDEEIIRISPDKRRYVEKFQFEVKDTKKLKMNNIKEEILNQIRVVQKELRNELENIMKNYMKDAYSNALKEPDWKSMKSYLRDYVENNKSKIFDGTINDFQKQVPLSIKKVEDYVIKTVFTALNENIENDYACFWEISRQSNTILEEKDKFIRYVSLLMSDIDSIKEINKE